MSRRVGLFLDLEPATEAFLQDVLKGLSGSQKMLPPKYFYDRNGSMLFDQICELDEYYLTRTEMSILTDHLCDITAALGDSVILVEYGSGSSTKTRLLLNAIPDVRAYVPIDISREHLLEAAEQIKQTFDAINVLPVCADYSLEITLDLKPTPDTKIRVFFPGSTIGNFDREHVGGL